MDAIFLKLLNMSIAAGWLIIAVIALRLILGKAPKWVRCILWAIVAVRLICPFTIESPLSLIPSAETVSPAVVRYAQEPVINSGIPYINSTLNPVISKSFSPAPGGSVNPLQVWMFIAGAVWVIGLIVMLCHALVSFLRIHVRVREAVRLRDNIWLCDAVKSPFILGVFRPQIYISSAADSEQLSYILAHEQAHIKRRDHWWKLSGYLLLSVYWFNPLMWLAYVLLCRDIELACDEKVIRDMSMDGKKAYSNALVDCSVQRRLIAACPLAFGEVGVKERVKSVLNYRKPAFWIIIMAAAACAMVAVCFLTNPRKDAFDIKVVIPAGSEQIVHYSNEEISPRRSRITLSSGEGLGDTEVSLLPIEVKEENAYDEPVYMTPGMPVKMNVEKGAWFRVGVAVSNPTNEDIIVYVHVKGVEIRIEDMAINENGSGDGSGGGVNGSGDGNGSTGVNSNGSGNGSESVGGSSGNVEENADAGDMVQYNGNWYGKENLSDETLEWLEWYNSLSESGQLAVNYVPYDLYELAGYGDNVETYDALHYNEDETITFIGMIVENTADSIAPIILVKPFRDDIPYEYIFFILPENEAYWGVRINDIVAITCTNSFTGAVEEERGPIYGELVSIKGLDHINEAVIHNAISDRNSSSAIGYDRGYYTYNGFACSDFAMLDASAAPIDGGTAYMITFYGWALYQRYNVTEKGIEDVGGSHIPVALTFKVNEKSCKLTEYWEPGDGSDYGPSIRSKFPAHIVDDALDSQKFIVRQVQNCYNLAARIKDLDTDAVIGSLLDKICSSPETSSNPYDYIDAHSLDYRELLYYGEYTLRYCLNRFNQGNETGLEGKVMAVVCEELLQTEGKIPLDASDAETGQLWYDTLRAHAGNRVKPYIELAGDD